MQYKSEVVDTIINILERRMRHEKKHLLKTDTILQHVSMHINLSDDYHGRAEGAGGD